MLAFACESYRVVMKAPMRRRGGGWVMRMRRNGMGWSTLPDSRRRCQTLALPKPKLFLCIAGAAGAVMASAGRCCDTWGIPCDTARPARWADLDLPTPTCGARAAGWRELEYTCACAHMSEALREYSLVSIHPVEYPTLPTLCYLALLSNVK